MPTAITQLVYWPLVTLYSLEFTLFLFLFSDCRAGQVMVHNALKIPESRLPPLLVRRLPGLLFWLYSLSLAFGLPGHGKLKLKAF